MSGVPVKLLGFAGALALAFGGAYAAGGAIDPVVEAKAEPSHNDMPAGDTHGTGHSDGTLPGLAVSEAGYTLSSRSTTLPAGRQVPFAFRISRPDGRPLTAYELSHEKELHLIVVRRDLTGFQHVHPVRAKDGTWSVPLDLTTGGTWRVFADFTPQGLGRGLTLGTDITVPGSFQPRPLPEATSGSKIHGYDVTLTGTAVAGQESELTFTISRNGRQVTDLQPYLGAFGHLVSLRTGDLAYLHTHPTEHADAAGGPEVRFGTTFPTNGTYRLFLDFRHAGAVHTAEFTVHVGNGPRPKETLATTPRPTAHATTPHGHR